MHSKFIKFKTSEVIEAYKHKATKNRVNETEDFDFDADDPTLYKDYILEIETKDKYDPDGAKLNKEIYVNINPLITALIEKESEESSIKDMSGFVICKSDHTTSSVFISSFNEETLLPLSNALKKAYPYSPKKYKHNIWDHKYKNANAHLKSVFTGNGNITACTEGFTPISIAKSGYGTKSCVIPFCKGKLLLPPGDDVINAEFDYRPDKTFMIALFYDV